MSLVDLKADILKTIASRFDTTLRRRRFFVSESLSALAVSKEFCATENIDHENPAILLDIYRICDLEKKACKPVARVRVDVTVEEL